MGKDIKEKNVVKRGKTHTHKSSTFFSLLKEPQSLDTTESFFFSRVYTINIINTLAMNRF